MEILDGITVLNTLDKVYRTFGWTPFALIPIMLFAFILIFSVAISMTTNDYDGLGGVILACIMGGLLLTFMICSVGKKVSYTTYEVTIEDSVSLQEFNKRYEIIEQRGEIYIIKEKDK